MDRLSKLRAGREIPQVVLQKYNQLRSKVPEGLVCAFEGYDDLTFYDTAFRRMGLDVKFHPLVCKGKDQVLGLRVLLARNAARGASLVRYFVDHDFDGLKGCVGGDDIYCTPCYSIENLLVCHEVLKGLLISEFRCNDENAEEDIRSVIDRFDRLLSEFFVAMYEVNKLIFLARRSMIALSNIEDDIYKYVRININGVFAVADRSKQVRLVGYASAPTIEETQVCDSAFDKLHPKDDWRGKFIYSFFTKFLSEIKEDRGQKEPRLFSSRANVTFSPGHDIVRTLAALTPLPKCLSDFIKNLPVSSGCVGDEVKC